MNRIQELRERKGWSQAELAKRVGTSQPQIDRLEKGTRRLTEDWMRRVAKALDVRATELLELATAAELENDVETYLPDASLEMARPLSARNLSYYRIIGRSLERADMPPGRIILVDGSAEAIKARKNGDVLLIEVRIRDGGRSSGVVRVLRQYLAPALATTNHSGVNVSFSLDRTGTHFDAKVAGVMVA
jgi:transcriptional regulator with XRE-family HTH domain